VAARSAAGPAATAAVSDRGRAARRGLPRTTRRAPAAWVVVRGNDELHGPASLRPRGLQHLTGPRYQHLPPGDPHQIPRRQPPRPCAVPRSRCRGLRRAGSVELLGEAEAVEDLGGEPFPVGATRLWCDERGDGRRPRAVQGEDVEREPRAARPGGRPPRRGPSRASRSSARGAPGGAAPRAAGRRRRRRHSPPPAARGPARSPEWDQRSRLQDASQARFVELGACMSSTAKPL
jgi:hypothetical protein